MGNTQEIEELLKDYGGYFSVEEIKELAVETHGAPTKRLHLFDHFEPRPKSRTIDLLQENVLGRGLGNTLGLLRDRGALMKSGVEWAGRDNDKKLLPHQTLVKEALFSGYGDGRGHEWH